ncbi:MAG TPA: ferritin family protein [Syntrophomonadaceae bacterium]|jgi:rubrerythrin|nr:ferritin family protein [Syntrophomonadaceae bacterium]
MDNNEIKILKTAILNEIEGEKFYKRAAQDTRDQDASKAFLAMAADERRHQEMLREMLTHVMSGTQMMLDKFSLKGTPSPQIFTATHVMETENAMEISVFHIAIMMEKASIDYYRSAAEQTKTPEAKELYLSLADWEVTHLDSMEKIYDTLTENWWDHQSYSPS